MITPINNNKKRYAILKPGEADLKIGRISSVLSAKIRFSCEFPAFHQRNGSIVGKNFFAN